MVVNSVVAGLYRVLWSYRDIELSTKVLACRLVAECVVVGVALVAAGKHLEGTLDWPCLIWLCCYEVCLSLGVIFAFLCFVGFKVTVVFAAKRSPRNVSCWPSHTSQ